MILSESDKISLYGDIYKKLNNYRGITVDVYSEKYFAELFINEMINEIKNVQKICSKYKEYNIEYRTDFIDCRSDNRYAPKLESAIIIKVSLKDARTIMMNNPNLFAKMEKYFINLGYESEESDIAIDGYNEGDEGEGDMWILGLHKYFTKKKNMKKLTESQKLFKYGKGYKKLNESEDSYDKMLSEIEKACKVLSVSDDYDENDEPMIEISMFGTEVVDEDSVSKTLKNLESISSESKKIQAIVKKYGYEISEADELRWEMCTSSEYCFPLFVIRSKEEYED